MNEKIKLKSLLKNYNYNKIKLFYILNGDWG